jgi:uncharacterized membrane protein
MRLRIWRLTMKKMIVATWFAAFAATTLSACTTTEKGAVGGAIAGAAVGQIVGRNTESTLIGAAVGAAGGALAGELVGRQANGNCVYQKADGTQFIARCPS